MENNPLRTKQEERGRYTIPNIKEDTYIRQKLKIKLKKLINNITQKI